MSKEKSKALAGKIALNEPYKHGPSVSDGAIKIIQGLKGRAGPDLADRLKAKNKKHGKHLATALAYDKKQQREADR